MRYHFLFGGMAISEFRATVGLLLRENLEERIQGTAISRIPMHSNWCVLRSHAEKNEMTLLFHNIQSIISEFKASRQIIHDENVEVKIDAEEMTEAW